MRFERAELHNHSVESDGSLSVRELMEYAEEHRFGVVALTNHNTCSGFEKAEYWIKKDGRKLSLIKGVEITTFYGHILALGVSDMINWTDLDPGLPEPFLRRIRGNGAVCIGIAHPFCLGRPVTAGCRFDMDVHDWSLIDYLEVFNTGAGSGKRSDTFMGNEKALQKWEELVLEGYHLSAVSGKDLHKPPKDDKGVMTTYTVWDEGDQEDISPAERTLGAILRQRTMVTKGPLLWGKVSNGQLLIELHINEITDVGRNSNLLLWIKSNSVQEKDTVAQHPLRGYALQEGVNLFSIPLPTKADTAVIRLYKEDTDFDNLLAAGVIVRWKEDETE